MIRSVTRIVEMPIWLIQALPVLAFAVVLAIPIIVVAAALSRSEDGKDKIRRKGYSQWIE